MKGHWIKYSAEEMAWLETNHLMPVSAYYEAFQAVFGRKDIEAKHLHALRKRKGWHTGRTGRFEKGSTPHNKGVPCEPGKGGRHPNARKTQFRKGARPHTYRGPGHERIDNKDGYVILIVAETNPWTGAKTRPVHKHRWLWEQKHGTLPKGTALKCIDGDKTNTDPSNWELISRSLLPRLAGGRHEKHIPYDTAPAELKPAILAVAKLEQAARDARKQP